MDSVLLEIFANKTAAATVEMAAALQRTSRSLYVKEAADFGTGLVDLRGKIFAYPPTASVPFFLDSDCGTTIETAQPLEPGDVIITNDPYLSGGLATHLPDLHMVQPYFHKGRIVAYGWCFVHSNDIGGVVPSSILPTNHEIFQEGLRIPPTKILEGGVMNAGFIRIYRANCRTPDENMGDLRAMLGALHMGGRRVADMIARHGVEALLEAQQALQDYAAAKARAVLRRIPDGVYDSWDYMDDDYVTSIPLRVRVRMTANDGCLHLDLSDSDPQVMAAYNVVTMGRLHEWLTMRLTTFILTHDRSTPMNAGIYRHVSVTNPPGTVLNAEFPDAVGIRQTTATALNDAVTGAIFQAVPELMATPSCGVAPPLTLAEYDGSGSRRTVSALEPLRGGMGAYRGRDGVDGRDATLSNMSNHPVEVVESDSGVIIREYDVVPDGGGAGQWRGGAGQLVTVEILRDGGSILSRGMERLRFAPWGVAGGKPGTPLRCILNKGRPDERPLGKISELRVNAGDTVTFMMPGASGYGDPFLRDPGRVLADVEQGFVSRGVAERDYGVVIGDDGRLDEAATARTRAARRKDNARAAFDYGPEREAWEAVFDDQTMREINRRLYALPKSVRQRWRRWLVERTVPDLPRAGLGRLADAMADSDSCRKRLRRAMAELPVAKGGASS